eukprot:scaffold67089_cov34-Tisochrysis_lutea.AAC.2
MHVRRRRGGSSPTACATCHTQQACMFVLPQEHHTSTPAGLAQPTPCTWPVVVHAAPPPDTKDQRKTKE